MDNSIKKMETKTNGNCDDNDLQLQDPETFETSLLRYLDFTKVDILEISNCISSLNNIAKDIEDSSVELLIEISSDTSETPQQSTSVKTVSFEKCRKKVPRKKARRRCPLENQLRKLVSCFSPNSSDSSSSFSSSQKSLSPVQLFSPIKNAEKSQRVKRSHSEMESLDLSFFDELSYEKKRRVSHSQASDNSSCINTTQDSSDRQRLLSLLDESDESSSPISKRRHSDNCQSALTNEAVFPKNGIPESILDELLPVSDREYLLTPEPNYSESILQSLLDEPIPDCDLPPPLLPIPLIREHSPFMGTTKSQSFLLSNEKEFSAIKDLPRTSSFVSLLSNEKEFSAIKDLPRTSSFVSLLPSQLRGDIGKNLINSIDIYHIIIDKKIEFISGIENEMESARISEMAGELQQVPHQFADHLVYYNTYFRFLLLEYFCKISLAWKKIETREKLIRNVCKIVSSEVKQRYVSFQCESFIPHSEEDKFPKDGDIILANFYTESADNIRLLGYVCSSASRRYSHRRDDGHEMLKYVNVSKRKNVTKIKMKFHTVFDITGIILDLPIYFFKLMNLRETLKLNEALKKLRRSPLCETVLRPCRNNVKSFVLPSYQDLISMATIAEDLVKSLNPLTSQMTVVKCTFFMDFIISVTEIVKKMKSYNIRGQMLICVREEFLSQMGLNLIKTSSNIVIISKKEKLHEKLESRILDVMVSHLTKDIPQIPEDIAKNKVLQEADVLLATTETCFYEHVRNMAADIAYCIIHDAHSFTEPEILLPLLYGIRHLLLFGDPDESCNVNSKYAASLGYNKNLFHRAYKLP